VILLSYETNRKRQNLLTNGRFFCLYKPTSKLVETNSGVVVRQAPGLKKHENHERFKGKHAKDVTLF